MEDLIQQETERFAAIRMQLLEMHPFWGYLLLQMELLPAPELDGIAATDMIRHIWFNPQKTAQMDTAELGFVLLHEIGHQVLASDVRSNGRNPYIWNQATDYVINGMVRDIRHPNMNVPLYKMPPRILWDEKLSYMTAESVYERLCKTHTQDELQYIQITVNLPGGGGGSSGLKVPLTDHGGNLDIHIPVSLSEEQREELRDRLGAALENYYENGEKGDIPESFLQGSGLLTPPKIPWQRVLRRYVDSILSGDDYSLARPNKRYLTENFIVPGKYSETVSSVVVALDTSASMTREELCACASEIIGIIPNAEELTFITADARIQQVFHHDELEDALKQCAFKGGGGTSHICVFDYIRQNRLNPRLFIGLTDLYSSFPAEPPPYPVLWLTPPTRAEAPWGKQIEL